jgi:hypothetical protein
MSIIVDKPYSKELKPFSLKEISLKQDLFITRPPYQRKNVWSNHQKESLIESFFRRFYVPDVVLREVNTPSYNMKYEVVDGQQRIIAISDFFNDKIKLPKELSDITQEAGKKYSELSLPVKNHIDQQTLNATVLGGLTTPSNKLYQQIVAKVFWNLQQGKTLSYMEVEHSKLYSASRNFLTKFADNMSFDNTKYESLDFNKDRHKFFEIINVDNDRLDHLALLGRFLMLEEKEGPAELGLTYFVNFIDEWNNRPNEAFEASAQAKRCLKTLDVLFQIFSDHQSVKAGGKVPELDREYIIISIYLLARRLVHDNWNFTSVNFPKFRSFVNDFYIRWGTHSPQDADMIQFRGNRQQNKKSVEVRDQLITEWFFKYFPELNKLDAVRNFSYLERVMIYRKNQGVCQACKSEGKSEEEALVPWHDFEADHLKPWSKEGKTSIENGQVLCRFHNRSKGANCPT